MKIKINNKTIDLNPMLKKGIGVVELDNDEKLIVNHKGSVRRLLIDVDKFDDLCISHHLSLLKSIKEIKEELNEVKNEKNK